MKKKKASQILNAIRDFLFSPELETNGKIDEKAFSRKRSLNFQLVVFHILYLLKESLQMAIFELAMSLSISPVSKQALCLARKKVRKEAFILINDRLIYEFYTENMVKTFLGFILLAIDGTTFQLPDSQQIKNKYGLAKNHLGESTIPLGRVSCCHDVVNKITLDTIIKTCEASERSLAIEHLRNTFENFKGKSTLHLYDRGYTSLTLMFYHYYIGKDFVIRSNITFFPVDLQARIQNGETDFIIEFSAKKIKGLRKRAEFSSIMPNIPFTSTIKVRILIIELSSGEKEILMTSLTDPKIPHEAFKAIYNKRWGAEESYKVLKVLLEIENFSGKSELTVFQDVYATIFAANMTSIISQEAQDELNEEKDNWTQHTHAYQINQNIAIGALREELVVVLLDPDSDLEAFCYNLKQFMKKNTTAIRPDRIFPRIRKSSVRKFHISRRRCM